jgi:hypothetical protein
MYTISVVVLCVISIFLIVNNTYLYKDKAFLFWLLISCFVGWNEFVSYLRFDAWVFDPLHIIGFKIIGVTIEDYIFCPCFSIIFWKLYHCTKLRFKQRVFNPTDKLIFAVFSIGIALSYFNIGSIFGKYMALRASIGFVGLFYCWNSASFRHALYFFLIVFMIGFGWDLVAVNLGHWTYIQDVKNISPVFDGLYLKIINAIFPIELFGYYYTGAAFSFWTMALLEKYFGNQERIFYLKQKKA